MEKNNLCPSFTVHSEIRIHGLPSRELTYPTLGSGKSSSKMPLGGDMFVPRRVFLQGMALKPIRINRKRRKNLYVADGSGIILHCAVPWFMSRSRSGPSFKEQASWHLEKNYRYLNRRTAFPQPELHIPTVVVPFLSSLWESIGSCWLEDVLIVSCFIPSKHHQLWL